MFGGIASSFQFALAVSAAAQTASRCKPTPASPEWPSDKSWQTLNQSVSGRLHAIVPPGAVCHPDNRLFNDLSCKTLVSQWTNSTWHSNNPFTADYNDEACLPDAKAPCSPGQYPAYAIEAMGPEDVQRGVNFARETGIRLIVKGTGHDFQGRSSGAHSLSIWTHRMTNITIIPSDPRATIWGGVASVKMYAGLQFRQVLQAATDNNITVIGGADPNVGIGGWISGGGHGPLTAKYGLGADQVLEMEVVTADGQWLHINETSHSDLFWAMRGGGGSTFGVIISVTVKAYPKLGFSQSYFSYNTTADSETFWSLTALFHSHLPRLSESGVMGYYFVTSNTTLEPDPAQQGKVSGQWVAPNLTTAQLRAVLSPLDLAISASSWPDKIHMSHLISQHPDFMAAWKSNEAQAVGISGRLSSRLFDGPALIGNVTALKLALRDSSPQPWPILGHLIAGPGTRNAVVPGGSNAAHPAWRRAYSHIILPRSWPPRNTTSKTIVTDLLRNVQTPKLASTSIDVEAAYMSEADPTEPEWQQTFWGSNYPSLLEIKKRWDPRGVFWCNACVGSEMWKPERGDGIGQSEASLCRVWS